GPAGSATAISSTRPSALSRASRSRWIRPYPPVPNNATVVATAPSSLLDRDLPGTSDSLPTQTVTISTRPEVGKLLPMILQKVSMDYGNRSRSCGADHDQGGIIDAHTKRFAWHRRGR